MGTLSLSAAGSTVRRTGTLAVTLAAVTLAASNAVWFQAGALDGPATGAMLSTQAATGALTSPAATAAV